MKSEVEVRGDTIRLTRIFNAPRSAVFAWWSTAEKMQQWFGCAGMTSCQIEMDFHVGGTFKQTMQIAGRGEFSSSAIYEEIVVPEKIVQQVFLGSTPSRVTVEFFEHGNQTRLVMTHEGITDEMYIKNISQGTVSALEKLAELL